MKPKQSKSSSPSTSNQPAVAVRKSPTSSPASTSGRSSVSATRPSSPSKEKTANSEPPAAPPVVSRARPLSAGPKLNGKSLLTLILVHLVLLVAHGAHNNWLWSTELLRFFTNLIASFTYEYISLSNYDFVYIFHLRDVVAIIL